MPMNEVRPALLVLADGTLFEGEAIGAEAPGGVVSGEVVFNTASTGYQEILTDPSYAGQIIAFTSPHIGNYGVAAVDDEARRPFARGIVVRDLDNALAVPSTSKCWQTKPLLSGRPQLLGLCQMVSSWCSLLVQRCFRVQCMVARLVVTPCDADLLQFQQMRQLFVSMMRHDHLRRRACFVLSLKQYSRALMERFLQ